MQPFADASPKGSTTVSNASTNQSPDRLATVVEAAEILGITPDAVRSRLRRGTLKRSPERGSDGEVLVVMPSHHKGDQSPTVAESLVEQMASEIAHLRKIVEIRDEEIRRRDTILMALTQRIPELEAPGEQRDAPETASPRPDRGAGGGDQEKRVSWWRRFFGFEA